MYTIQELIKEHVQEKCKYCIRKNCNGINITIDKKTRCDRNEN